MQQRTRELSALFDVAATATQSLDLNPILQEVAEKITDVFGLDSTRIYLLDHQHESCASGPLADTTRKVLSKGVFGQRQGIVGKAVETGEPIIFEDVQNDPRYAELSHSKGSRGIGYRFFAAVPIKAKGKSLGAIACNGQLVRQLTEQELRLMTSMADQIGPAIDNINLFEELKEKTTALEESNQELVESLEQQTEIAKVLQSWRAHPRTFERAGNHTTMPYASVRPTAE